MQLILGNKNYSSWSLRPWLLLRHFGLPFEEIRIPLYVDNHQSKILEYSPAGKVPVLLDGECRIWDSLAICEYVSDHWLQGTGWPTGRRDRAEARSCSAEMHSGFLALRTAMPMNCRALDRTVQVTPALATDLQRIEGLWNELRARYSESGPWLFGKFCIADCMFAPVAFRLRTYGFRLEQPANDYAQALLRHPAMQEWADAAFREPEILPENEVGVP